MKTATITGANGFIGSHLLCRLLAQGWRVHALGRSSATTGWPERVLAAAAEVCTLNPGPGQLEFHEVDLLSPKLNLERLFDANSAREETFLFHVAGDTRFKPADPEVQRRVNVEAPLALVSALRGGISRVVHVSTAYVAGRRTGLVAEDELDCRQEFWNSYEKSKFDAELQLTRLCRQEGLALVIVRPAIIINDRETGRASTFTHLNALVEVVSRLQDFYGLSDGQVVSHTIRLLADPEARPNLAPIDSIMPALLRIAESPAAPGRTFHLCHPRPQTNAEILALMREAYQVTEQLSLEFVQQLGPPISHTEEMVARSLKVYAPYMNNRVEFDLRNSRSVVPDYDAYFSPIDLAYIRKVIAFQRRKHQQRQQVSG